MRTTTWRPASLPSSLPEDLALEVARLQHELALARQEIARLESDLVRERGGQPRAQTADFAAPRALLQRSPSPRPSSPVESDITTLGSARAGEPAPFAASPVGVLPFARPEQGIDFGAVQQLSPEQLDRLPYGLITLDAEGRILHYNDTESRMVGLPKHKVLGRRFFGEVAPCARVREFEGRFEELVRDPYRVRVQTFDFVFRFANGEQQVTIVLTPAKTRGQYHMALLRRSGT